MIVSCLSQPNSHNILSRFLVVVALAATGILSGVTPELSQDSHTLVFSSAVYGQQAVTDDEITRYTKAVLAMEPLRQVAYNEIKKIMSGNVPEIECHRPQTIQSLPNGEARQIAIIYCEQALKLVVNYLSTARFNEITRMADNNANLEQKIQARMIQLQ